MGYMVKPNLFPEEKNPWLNKPEIINDKIVLDYVIAKTILIIILGITTGLRTFEGLID